MSHTAEGSQLINKLIFPNSLTSLHHINKRFLPSTEWMQCELFWEKRNAMGILEECTSYKISCSPNKQFKVGEYGFGGVLWSWIQDEPESVIKTIKRRNK